MARSSAFREQLTQGREAGRSLMKKEKYMAKNGSLRNTSMDSKGTTFVILETTQARVSEREDRAQRAKMGGQPK